MSRLRLGLTAGLLTAGATFCVPVAAPLAVAATDDVPDVRVKVRSISLDGYTGSIVVAARVRCTQQVDGVGSASWAVTVVQQRRASSDAGIPCDGVRTRAVLQLEPNRGRFHPGSVNVTLEQTAVGSKLVEIESTSFSTAV